MNVRSYEPLSASSQIECLQEMLIDYPINDNEKWSYLSEWKDNGYAKAILDIGHHLIRAKESNEGLSYYLFGRDLRDFQSIGRGISLGSFEQTKAKVEDLVANGVSRFKMKITPLLAIDELATLMADFPDQLFSVDANGSFEEKDWDLLMEIDKLSLAAIEQPFGSARLDLFQRLTAVTSTPICLDESIRCVEDVKAVIGLNAGNMICIKPCRVGGITPSLQIMKICKEHGLGYWIGGQLESDLGTLLNLCLAGGSPPNFPSDLPGNQQLYDFNMITKPFKPRSKRLKITDYEQLFYENLKPLVEPYTNQIYEFNLPS